MSLICLREIYVKFFFRIGMSDGGLVTEAKPPVKWNKVQGI